MDSKQERRGVGSSPHDEGTNKHDQHAFKEAHKHRIDIVGGNYKVPTSTKRDVSARVYI